MTNSTYYVRNHNVSNVIADILDTQMFIFMISSVHNYEARKTRGLFMFALLHIHTYVIYFYHQGVDVFLTR